jgi:hypothetical protein
VFSEIRPATSMVEVRALIDPQMLVEIEADAMIADPPRSTTRSRRGKRAKRRTSTRRR